jgi:hypothetical protein
MLTATNSLFVNTTSSNYYEGEDAAAAEAAAAAAAAAAKGKTFTQEQVNTMLAEDRRKSQTKLVQMEATLTELSSNETLSKEQRTALETQLADVQTQLRTKEQQAALDKKKLEESAATDKQKAAIETEVWRNRYTGEKITREIRDAAMANKAFNPTQIDALLKPTAKLVDVLGDDQKPTGEMVVKILFNDVDDKGSPVNVELLPAEAVKRMTELPEKYGNLFEGTLKGGTGSHGSDGKGKGLDISKLPPGEYQRLRREGKLPHQR